MSFSHDILGDTGVMMMCYPCECDDQGEVFGKVDVRLLVRKPARPR